jgi:hypothetical protein
LGVIPGNFFAVPKHFDTFISCIRAIYWG